MKEIFKTIVRELKYISKSKLYIFALLLFPLTDCLLLGGIYASGTLSKLPIAVIDEDNSKISRNIIRYFNASPDMQVKYRLQNLSQLKDLFSKNKAYLGVYIPRNLSKNIKKQKPQTVSIYTNSSNYITGNITSLDAATIIGTISGGIKYKTLTKKGVSSKQVAELLLPIKNDTAKLFNPALNYNIFLTPGLWLSVIQQLLILFGALTIATEFDLKTIKSMMIISRNNLLKVMLGKIAIYVCVAFIHFEILYRFFFPIFSIPIVHSETAAILLSLSFAFAAIALGMLLSSILKTRLNALKGCFLISSPAFLLSGYTWPLEQFPPLLQVLTQIIPLTPFLEGFRKIYQQNIGLIYCLPFLKQLIVMGILYFALAYVITLLRINKMEAKYEIEIK